MANIENSPFNRSSKTCRSPPSTPQPAEHAAEETLEALSTSDIKGWMVTIEKALNDVCQIAAEGKLNSEQKLNINTLARRVGNGVSQMAIHYQTLKQRACQIKTSLEALREKEDLAACLNDFKKSIKESIQENCSKPVAQNMSFADILKTNKSSVLRPSNLKSIAIYPNDALKSSDETKTLVQKIINPEQMKLHVRGMRKTRNGGVIISTESNEDIEKLRRSSQLTSSGLKVEEPHKRRPRIIVVGVPAALRDQEVFDSIYEQNLADKMPNMSRESFLSCIKLSHKSGKKDAPTCNFIIEVPANVRKALINQERIYINWTSCPVRDFTLVTRCFKCQQYGHAAKTCREVTCTCGHCGEQGHETKDCTKKDKPPKCATCSRFKKPSSHKTGDLECPAKKTAETRYINSIDYNEGA
ncbi:uncharacterized protein LOC111362215 [Spodoptera litura]|uniref:Uncharacterized protein LOC111354322 n=1 Tax=Spodoptera litura TaxID=69820 RepID=A0A9J7ESY3_SPOLT|nr:uncharacterized protein LOC111354322 [Spodoptera litura]XP_022824032.1 uncharacterized protein LOC111354730 [Spodoptera litura]XP_022832651.1 uncharacterized protein LOC111360736 [Spodoptera litura]XP_022834287.1 uncharacterized protein LOC111362021 [Spodoptera litura]XP_022834492.1 uncharacterized protein LOC111362161 [Spodoptera litura]XP_022834535.1 uncharacterized protein LOC111362196 [Spodoptera litura]XP_022834557.1 uncharacterized protein LOC111362215 [Spodoptera litura]